MKPYKSDGMNGFGKNLNRTMPDMLEYWNFYLTNEMQTTTRQKYTWLDNFAFIGGNIDFMLMTVAVFFAIGLLVVFGLLYVLYNSESKHSYIIIKYKVLTGYIAVVSSMGRNLPQAQWSPEIFELFEGLDFLNFDLAGSCYVCYLPLARGGIVMYNLLD